MLGWKMCGWSLANNIADTSRKHDRGFAKVTIHNLLILANYKTPEKTWSRLNTEECEAFWEKRQDKSCRRHVKAKPNR